MCSLLATCWLPVGYLLATCWLPADSRSVSRPKQVVRILGSNEDWPCMAASGPHVPGSHPTSGAFFGQLRRCNRFFHHFFEKVLPAICGKHIFASNRIAFGVQKSHFQPSKGEQKSPYGHLFPLRSLLGPVVSPFFRAMGPSKIAFSPVTCAHLSSMSALGADLEPTNGAVEPAWGRSRAI